MTDRELAALALEARARSYAPYSHFAVGAALLADDGRAFQGCNIENAAYSPGNCAERTAFFVAISQGVRGFAAMAIAGGPEGAAPSAFCAPCGVCRQVMREFCDPDAFRVLLVRDGGSGIDIQAHTLAELLPMGFGPSDLEG